MDLFFDKHLYYSDYETVKFTIVNFDIKDMLLKYVENLKNHIFLFLKW